MAYCSALCLSDTLKYQKIQFWIVWLEQLGKHTTFSQVCLERFKTDFRASRSLAVDVDWAGRAGLARLATGLAYCSALPLSDTPKYQKIQFGIVWLEQ